MVLIYAMGRLTFTCPASSQLTYHQITVLVTGTIVKVTTHPELKSFMLELPSIWQIVAKWRRERAKKSEEC